MKELSDLKTEQQLLIFADQLIGEGKECEKCLFMAAGLFLNIHCQPNERTFSHMIRLVLQASPTRQEAKQNTRQYTNTTFENLMLQFVQQYPNESTTSYFEAFLLFPPNTASIAVGNLAYRLIAYQGREENDD